ncbi:hypothetical protein [Flavobacterium sp. ABG]|uniref:hypothetical protein n=1 Tax=Flavobacterium sp. ABG TaxID=1423322 RepID=UPI0013F40B8B|nr:hypothetical protein [Flavobacterium sp. ABG]
MKNAQYIIFLGGLLAIVGALLAGKQADKDAAIAQSRIDSISSTVQKINNETTGGDSFPFLNIDVYNEGKEIEFKLYNYGKIKLNDVTMEISDGAKGSIEGLMTAANVEDELEKYTTTKFYNILYPNQSIRITDFKIDDSIKDICLTIHFKFGNKHLIELILFHDYKNPALRRGYVKIEDGTKTYLHYTIDKDFNRTYIVGFNI